MGEELFTQQVSDTVLSILIGAFLCYVIYAKRISHPVDYGRRCLAFMVLFMSIAALPKYFTFHDNSFLFMFVAGNLLYGGLSFWIGLFFGILIDRYKKTKSIPLNRKIKNNIN